VRHKWPCSYRFVSEERYDNPDILPALVDITKPEDKREPEWERSVDLVRDLASGKFFGKFGIRSGFLWAVGVKAEIPALCNDVSLSAKETMRLPTYH
jgi:hypothetical protein